MGRKGTGVEVRGNANVRGIVVARTQALERGVLVAEGGQKRERELRCVKGLEGQL